MGKRVVAITSCITGIAHTYMAAKALENAAEELGYEISVEKQGASGAEDVLSAEDIAAADAAVFATDRAVDDHLQAHHERRLSHAAHRCSGRHPDCSELCVRQCPE